MSNLMMLFLKLMCTPGCPTSDVLLPDDVGSVLKMFAIMFLLDDVDKVNGQNDVDVLDFPTVLDEQGDAEVSLCDLL